MHVGHLTGSNKSPFRIKEAKGPCRHYNCLSTLKGHMYCPESSGSTALSGACGCHLSSRKSVVAGSVLQINLSTPRSAAGRTCRSVGKRSLRPIVRIESTLIFERADAHADIWSLSSQDSDRSPNQTLGGSGYSTFHLAQACVDRKIILGNLIAASVVDQIGLIYPTRNII